MLVVHSLQKPSSAAADDASEFHSQPLDSQSGAKEPSGGASRSAAAGSKTAAAQPPKSQQARRQLLLPDQHRASNSRGGAQQQDATARGRKGRQSATGAPAAGAEGGGSQTRSRSAAARLATEAAASSSQQQEQQQQQQQQQAAVTADESLGTAAADAATEQQQQQQQQQGEGVQSPLREVLEGLWQREEGEVQPSMAQLAEAVWVVGQAALTAKGDCLAFQQQMEQVHKRQGELNQQLKKLLAMPGLQQQPTAAGAVAAASAEAEGLSSSIASMQQQLNAVQQKAEEGGTFLQRAGLGGEDAADKLKTALDAGSEASMKVSNLQTAHGILQGRVNGHDSELQRLKDQLARLEQQQRQQQQQQQHNPPALEGAEIVVWAPADPGMADKIAATLTAAARLSKGSVQYVACKFQRRSSSSSSGGGRDSSSSGGNSSVAGSSAAAAAAAGGGSRRKEPLALYVVRLASSSLVPTVLGGRTRLFLRQQGAPMWLDRVLTPEERQQRKQQQSVARELRAKGVQTRWRGHILEERTQRAAGRYQWVQVPPPPPLPSSPPPPLPSPERGPAATDGMAGDVGAS